ncbi:MAG: transcriptional regulator, partial [Nocardiopsaceae bacterium]|nr:transcriptional regulator [Nocardiopsaceae bacterium]
MTTQRQASPELTIGIIGPHDLVERVMLSGAATAGTAGPAVPGEWQPALPAGGTGPARRLVGAAYRNEQEAADKVLRLGSSVDACLFASRVPYEYARRAGTIRGPATWIPLSGSALYATLLRAGQDTSLDLARASVDVISRTDIEDAFTELGLPVTGVHVREDPASAATLAAFHERLWQRGQTSVAITCLESVAQRLAGAGVPALTVSPTGYAIRAALRTATLLGGQRRLEEAQLAVAVVEVPTLRETPRRGAPRHSREELRLTVHRYLLQETQRMQATVSPVGDHSFLVTATRGSLAAATDGFRAPPFADRARAELGLTIEVGVGLGRTAQDAEAHARAALARSHAGPGGRGFALDRDGHALLPAPRQPVPDSGGKPRGQEVLARLADKLSSVEGALVVDAETAGRLLGVTPRTARRLLHTLVEEGLAWPLPPSR